MAEALNNDLIEAERKLCLAKTEYFRQVLIHKSFTDALEFHDSKMMSYTVRDKTLRALRTRELIAQTFVYNHDSEFFRASAENLKHSLHRIVVTDEDFSKYALPIICKNIDKMRDNVLATVSNGNETEIVSVAREEVRKFEELGRNNEEMRLNRRELVKELIIEIIEGFGHLEKLSCDFSLSLQMETTHLKIQKMKENLRLISNDVESLNLLIKRSLFSPEFIKAMKNIARTISKKEKILDKELYDMKSLLNTYLSLGQSFSDLAREYGQVKSDYECLKWANDQYGSKN